MHPEWRAQWDWWESKGYVYYMPLMCLVHLPSLFCGFIDIASKAPSLLLHHLPSRMALISSTTTYHIAFEIWLFINWSKCGHAIPYPWYYEILISPYPACGLVAYLLFVNAMCCGIVLAYRGFVLWWVGRAAHPKNI